MSTELSKMIGRMPAAEGVSILVDAAFKYDPLLGSTAPLFRPVLRVSNRVPFRAAFIKKASYNATPVSGICDTSAFGKGNKEEIRKIEFSGQMYDYSGELCAHDFEQLCEVYGEMDLPFRLANPLAVLNQNELAKVIMAYKRETMLDDTVRIGYYSKVGAFAVNTASGSAPFYIGSVPNGAGTMLGNTQSGFWDLAAANIVAGLTPYVDTNGGTAPTNILNPANVYSILQKFIDNASPELRGASKVGPQAPFFMVDSSIFDALQNYYTQNGLNTNNTEAWRLQMQSVDVLDYKGYKVYRDNNADKFDTEIGAKTTSTIGGKSVTHSRNARVVFTVPQSVFIGLDMVTPSADSIGLIVAPAADQVKYPGHIFWKMMTSIGIFIGEPNMMVVGYPSVATTWL